AGINHERRTLNRQCGCHALSHQIPSIPEIRFIKSSPSVQARGTLNTATTARKDSDSRDSESQKTKRPTREESAVCCDELLLTYEPPCNYGLRSVQPVKFGFAFSVLETGRLIV